MKKIAVNTIKSFLKEHKGDDSFTKEFNVGDSAFEVVFRTKLTITEKSTFINRVLSGCFDSTGRYRPEYYVPVLNATIIQMCTNIPAIASKDQHDADGAPALDIDAMNDLYNALDMDVIDNDGYRTMIDEIMVLCATALEWKRDSVLAERNVDSAIRDLIVTITNKADSIDMDSLMQYASILSDGTKDLNDGSILNALLKARN